MRFRACFAPLALTLVFTSGIPAQSAPLAAAADALLAAPAAAQAHWGISVVDAATGTPLYAKNDAQLFEPASNAKLFTTAAALALLGPTYTMSTRVMAEGTIDAAGALHGNLRLVGGGDPTLSGRVYPYAGKTERSDLPLTGLDALASQVFANGIKALDGQVIADDTLFPDERYGAGWGWDDLQWEYGAPVSALVLNDNVQYLTVTPGEAAGQPATLSWLPNVPGFAEPTAITATTTSAGTAPALGVARDLRGDALLRIYGSLPAGGAPTHLALAVNDPARFAAVAFRVALQNTGLTAPAWVLSAAYNPARDTQPFAMETHTPLALQALPPGSHSLDPAATTDLHWTGRLVASRESVSLDQIVTVTNKVSQNLHAELLLHLLGRAEGVNGSAAQGARVVRAFLTTSAGILPDDFLLYDGSGLSTKDLVTPRSITTLLRYSTTQPWGALYRASLPIAGVDGSLQARLLPLRGRVQAKTGTLGEVDALSGFLTAASGRLILFSILCNDHPAPGARATLDALVAAIAQNE